jgi:uncharacterized membrane protein (UPF0136 family)
LVLNGHGFIRNTPSIGGRTRAMFEFVRFYLFGFGALTVAGGVLGFVKAKSRASLIAGSIAGGLLMVAGYFASDRSTHGLRLGLALSLALTIRFLLAYRRNKKIMPAGIIVVLGIIGAALTGLALLAMANTHA